jgi:hypothetical protein
LSIADAVFSGTIETDTVSGVANFDGIRILTGDSLTLTASATDMVSGVSDAFTVENFVYWVEIDSNNTSPSVNFTIILTVTLKGEDNLAFPGTCTVTISESTSSMVGTSLEQSITGGSGTFEVYLKTAGTKTIVASCPNTGTSDSKTGNVELTVLAPTIKINPTSPTVL